MKSTDKKSKDDVVKFHNKTNKDEEIDQKSTEIICDLINLAIQQSEQKEKEQEPLHIFIDGN